MTNETNITFYHTIKQKDYTEAQELSIYSSAYKLLAEIRQFINKPEHASHIFKEYKAETEQMTHDTIRLLNIIAGDEMPTGISRKIEEHLMQMASRKESHNRRWNDLLSVIGNTDTDTEKMRILIIEKTNFLQLTLEEQQHHPNFAARCQLEIDKILQLQMHCNGSHQEEKTQGNTPRSQKVTTDVVVGILSLAGITPWNDNTNLADLISFITGYSSESIRKKLSSQEPLPSRSKSQVQYINKIFKNLNIDISIG